VGRCAHRQPGQRGRADAQGGGRMIGVSETTEPHILCTTWCG
jgi:hypothetical protein